MGISGFSQWYPFGIKGREGHRGTYQAADENLLYRFTLFER
jgi:hypothetical protein